MADEWGPWIEHDGKGCPCVGAYVWVEFRDGDQMELVAGRETLEAGGDPCGPGSMWFWHDPEKRYPLPWLTGGPYYIHTEHEVVRYRIRKPRALQQLIESIEDIPQPVEAEA